MVVHSSRNGVILDIHPDSAVPIYEQIVTQVIFRVASGAMEAGEMLPSVREMAQRLLVNPNTVARAFQELERRGVVTSLRGRGMEVNADAPKTCKAERQEIIREQVRDALRQAASSALPPEEIRKLVEEELERVNGRKNDRVTG